MMIKFTNKFTNIIINLLCFQMLKLRINYFLQNKKLFYGGINFLFGS